MKGTIQHYSDKASHYYSLYNSVEAENVHNEWKAFLKTTSPGKALDDIIINKSYLKSKTIDKTKPPN